MPAQPTLYFSEAGNLEIFTSCNTGGGTFTTSEEILILTDISYTEEGCRSPNAIEADAIMQAVLADGEVSFLIEAASLTITRGDLGLSARTE